MDPTIRVLYIELDSQVTTSIRDRVAEGDAKIILEVASSMEAALDRLRISPAIHLILLEKDGSDPGSKDLLEKADQQGTVLPPVVLLLSDDSSGFDRPEEVSGIADRILRRDGALRELPYRLHSAYAQWQLRLQLAEQKRVEERLQVHQIELEMQHIELQQAHRELAESRSRYFDLYDLAPVGYCTVGQSGLIQEANLTLTTQLGVPRNALLNRRFGGFILKEDTHLFYHLFQNPGLDGLSRKLELRMVKADGMPTWMLLDICPRHGEDGAKAFRIIVTDISHLKRTEEALRISEAFNFSILNSMAPQIAVINKEGVIVRVNQSWRRFTSECGSNESDSYRYFGTGIHFRESARLAAKLISERGANEANIGIQAVLDGKLPEFNLEYFCQGISQPQWFILNATPLGPVSRGVVLSHTNITKHKLEEERIRESRKMLAIGTLAGGVAHDFNNILTIILANAELAQMGAAADPGLREYIKNIQKAGLRAVDIVKQILDFSHNRPTERKPTALGPIVEDIARLLQATLPNRHNLEVSCDPDTPMVLADATQIQQILLNVVTNAMQAVKEGTGHIGISLESAMVDPAMAALHSEFGTLDWKGIGRMARITVTDNGSGMDAATLKRIFEPYFSTKPVNEGTGLGLSIVYTNVRNHDGAILVESTPGGGSTFRIYFPEYIGNQSHGPVEKSEVKSIVRTPDAAGKRRILFLDDEEAIVDIFKERLEQLGYDFSGFSKPEEAIQAVRNAPGAFDLMVSDYNMPGMNGVDVAREIHKVRADLPVALASGYIDERVLAAGRQAGIRDFLFKVTAVEEIGKLMARLQESQSYIPFVTE